MHRLAIALPMYRDVSVAWFLNYGKIRGPIVREHVVAGVYLPMAMQLLIEQALQFDDWDRLLIMEHDMLPPAEAIRRIAEYEQDIVGSMYFSHDPPHSAMCYLQREGSQHHDRIAPETVKKWCDEPGLYEVHGIGMGFTSIARHVLESWDPAISMFDVDKNEIAFGSHDLWFCWQARKQGFRVWIDTGVICEHESRVPVGLADNQRTAHMLDGAPRVEVGKKPSVLNVGSGSSDILTPFSPDGWHLERLDFDPANEPDHLMDARQLKGSGLGPFDVVYSAHTIEHFQPEDVADVLAGMFDVLRPDGRLRIHTPSLEAIREQVEVVGWHGVSYESPVGPITPYDMMHGHQHSIAAGRLGMEHHCVMHAEQLRTVIEAAGFASVEVKRENFDLVATAVKLSESDSA